MTTETNLPLRAARQLGTDISAVTKRVMFAPAGVHTLTPAYGPASVQISIRVDATTAAVLNASLAQLNAANNPQRVFFDKNHEGKEAMAWPTEFFWSETPELGVYASVEWSSLGEQYVAGKVMRAFSGSFFTDAELPKKPRAGQSITIAAGKRGSVENPARIVGLGFPDAGTLTNDPAFRKILPIWAKNAGGGSPTCHSGPQVNQNTNTITMKLNAEQKATLQASIQTLEQTLISLRAQNQANPNDAAIADQIAPKETELDSAKAKLLAHEMAVKNEVLENALLAQRTKDADTAIQAAIQRGAIAPKDTALQETWKKMLVEDPGTNLPLLQAMRGSPALQQQRITVSGVTIQREDSVTVLRAYNAEKDPRKKAAIYARDLSERISKGEDLPIHAANTLGTLAGEIITQRTLELLLLQLPVLSRVGTDFSSEAAKKGQEINTRIVGIPGTSDYNEVTGYATENTVTTDVPVTIDQHKSVQVSFNANELASTSRRLFDELAPAMSYALGKVLCDALYAQITAAQFTDDATVEALVDFDRQSVISIGGALSDRGVPEMGRTLLLKGSYFDKLFSDSAIVQLAGFQKADVITQGQMIPVHGFDVIRAANLPATNNLAGFGFSKSALVLATRLPNDYSAALPGATGGGTVQTITEPSTGISLALVQFVDHQLGAAFARNALMYGTAKGQIHAGQRLTTQ